MIVLLAGPIRTGKTTALAQRFAADGAGILQPVLDGRRHVRDLTTGETRCLEAAPSTPPHARVGVGRFAFSASALAWADGRVRDALASAPRDVWVIVDEVGPLELSGGGLAASVRAAVAHGEGGGRVLLVVREGLVEAVTEAFGIDGPTVVRLGDRLPDGRRLPSAWTP